VNKQWKICKIKKEYDKSLKLLLKLREKLKILKKSNQDLKSELKAKKIHILELKNIINE